MVAKLFFREHCKPMFIFVFWVLLEIFSSWYEDVRRLLASWKNQRKKGELLWTFMAAKRCNGKGCGYTPRTKVCLKHWRSIEKSDNRCSSTLSETHGPKLTSIPRGLYHYIDKQGGKTQKCCPGSKWCHKC